MKEKPNIKKNIVQRFDLAPEAVGCVRLTLIDNTNAYLENYNSIAEYTGRRVGIKAGNYYVTIEGSGLELESFGHENVAVRGRIEAVRYEMLRER